VSNRPDFHPPAPTPAPPPAAGAALVLADPARRLAARFVDGILTFFIMLAGGLTVTAVFLAVYRGDMDRAGPEYGVPMMIVLLGTPFLYEWYQLVRCGATIGKRLAGIKVVRAADGGPVPKGRAALRALCYSPGIYHAPFYVPLLGQLNLLWLLWDKPLRQCLHDKAAKTMVVVGSVTAPATVWLPPPASPRSDPHHPWPASGEDPRL
jgi:uncharacterized RDD family membrane protein YckC